MSRRCKVYVYTGVFIVAVLLMALIIKLFFFSGWLTPLLSLKGEKVMEVQVKKSFQDPGVKARYHLKDYQNDVRITSNVNRNRIGEYTIVYEWKNKTVERIVKVVDKKSEIKIKKEIIHCVYLKMKHIKKQDIQQLMIMMEILQLMYKLKIM